MKERVEFAEKQRQLEMKVREDEVQRAEKAILPLEVKLDDAEIEIANLRKEN